MLKPGEPEFALCYNRFGFSVFNYYKHLIIVEVFFLYALQIESPKVCMFRLTLEPSRNPSLEMILTLKEICDLIGIDLAK